MVNTRAKSRFLGLWNWSQSLSLANSAILFFSSSRVTPSASTISSLSLGFKRGGLHSTKWSKPATFFLLFFSWLRGEDDGSVLERGWGVFLLRKATATLDCRFHGEDWVASSACMTATCLEVLSLSPVPLPVPGFGRGGHPAALGNYKKFWPLMEILIE